MTADRFRNSAIVIVPRQTSIKESGATGGLPTSAIALDAINVTGATDADWSIALADKLPVAPVN